MFAGTEKRTLLLDTKRYLDLKDLHHLVAEVIDHLDSDAS
jgi:hypothetical protein